MKLVLGQTVVDLDTCEAIRGDECTPLTQAEVALLRHLAEAAPATVTRQVLQVEALGYSERARTRAVDHAMARLRKKIEQDPTNPQFLVSVRGIGYRLQQPEPVFGIEAPDLVGRDRELAELNALPAGVHVLHGPGGMGKSSLGRALCGAHPGSHFVALAETTDLSAAVDALGQALGVPLRGGLDT